jgi:glycosyltransferase involved in cell wall biosynthesis
MTASFAAERTAGRPRRVVHVSFGLDVGGQERLLVELARHADRARFDLRFVSLGERGPLAGECEACGWPVEALGAPEGLRPGLLLRLAGRFRRWRPDVVHTHDNRALFYAAPAARLARVPRVVYTRHGPLDAISRREAAAFPYLARLVDRFVCVSADVAALSAREGVAPARIRTIRNGIDLRRFAYAGPRPAGPVVAVARLSPEKDLATLVRAAARAAPQDPELRVEVAGDGACRPALRRLAEELGLAGRVAFLGTVRDVPALLAGAGLFALPSRTEGIALTLLEAMACALPVVATRVGGTPEVVVDGQTGLLVPPADPAALAAALLRLRRDPEWGRRLGAAGRRRAEQLFDVRRMVAEYEALYLEGRARAGRPPAHEPGAEGNRETGPAPDLPAHGPGAD